jgi:hypothetical protein
MSFQLTTNVVEYSNFGLWKVLEDLAENRYRVIQPGKNKDEPNLNLLIKEGKTDLLFTGFVDVSVQEMYVMTTSTCK